MPRSDFQRQIDEMHKLLSRPPCRSSAQLAEALGVSPRTVQSYLRHLRESGYQLERDRQHRWRLAEERQAVTLHLSPQELALLQQVLRSLPGEHGLAAGLGSQLEEALNPRTQVYPAWYCRVGEALARLSEAIAAGLQVLLAGYRSGNSRVVRDRRVEPLRMSISGRTLIAYDPEAAKLKYFLITRIRQVRVLDQPVTYRGPAPEPDFFGWGGGTETQAELALDLYAYNYLLESYPDSEPHIREAPGDPDFPFRFSIPYVHPDGIGRFILSLPGHIRILAPDSLRDHVREAARWWEAS